MFLGWTLLRRELQRWDECGRRPVFWWRDDDARHSSPALDRLFALSERYACPLTVAVIPAGSHEGLHAQLADYHQISVAQHGVTHSNACGPGVASGEFGPGTRPEAIATAIRVGEERLRRRLPEAIGLYVPAWNRFSPELEAALTIAGVRCASGHGTAAQLTGALARLDVHVDLLRWRGGPRFRGEERFLRDVRRALNARRRAARWAEPVGLLTHHLDHDEDAWRFLDTFLRFSIYDASCDWACVRRLLPDTLIASERADLEGTRRVQLDVT